jgi:hypothetical protein
MMVTGPFWTSSDLPLLKHQIAVTTAESSKASTSTSSSQRLFSCAFPPLDETETPVMFD